jgi:hypothetical protein
MENIKLDIIKLDNIVLEEKSSFGDNRINKLSRRISTVSASLIIELFYVIFFFFANQTKTENGTIRNKSKKECGRNYSQK